LWADTAVEKPSIAKHADQAAARQAVEEIIASVSRAVNQISGKRSSKRGSRGQT